MKAKILVLFLFLTISVFSQISDIIPDYGFGGYQDDVIDSWIWSGSWPTKYTSTIIDVTETDFDIYPGASDLATKINALMLSLDENEQTVLYFPSGTYLIERPLTMRSNVIIKGAGGDSEASHRTQFTFEFLTDPEFVEGNCINFGNNIHDSGIEDIMLWDNTVPKVFFPGGIIKLRYNDLVSFAQGSYECWMKGVESSRTRRFHVNIYGHEITISGCYFHHSWEYGTGGRGYGVCISKWAYFNRVEDNIFEHLRHSMVFQYNPQQNVMAYNYSTDSENTYMADLLFHGKHEESVGPHWNLSEGNICEYLRFDDYHQENGPYNTIMRCKAEDSKVDKEVSPGYYQYRQNFVGTNSNPPNNTIERIDDYGYFEYWEDDPDWEEISSGSCSYYQEQRPDFFDNIVPWHFDWPYLPNDNNLIPAKYRFDRNNGYYQGDPPTTEVVYEGWDSYPFLCGPPNLYFFNTTVSNVSKEFYAINRITAEDYIMENSNHIVYKSENLIDLTDGFEVNSENSNYFSASIENCGGKILNKKNHKLTKLDIESLDKNGIMLKEKDEVQKIEIDNVLLSGIAIFPNPNNGIFSLMFPNDISFQITINDSKGINIFKKEYSSSNKCIIDISDKPKGIYFLTFVSNTQIKKLKLIYQ